MAALNRTQDQVKAAMRMVDGAEGTPIEKAEMLMEIAMELQQKPQYVEDIEAAINLYSEAMKIEGAEMPLLIARIRARMSTALLMMPSEDPKYLEEARENLEAAIPTFVAESGNEELAEAEMNLGLVLQNLASMSRAPITEAISAYQRSLRTFNKVNHPKEFAILQSNLATAFLSIPFTDERSKMREALAVQAFEEGLSVVTLIDNPSEYAMLQNNLGNALQYASSSHRVENGFRALEAYDEALKVRTRRNAPGEHANTISNKANCLANLPDDPASPEQGNPKNMETAIQLYQEAKSIFEETGEMGKVAAVVEAISELQQELPSNEAIENSIN